MHTYPDDAESFEVVHPWLGLGDTSCYYHLFLLFLGFSVPTKQEKTYIDQEIVVVVEIVDIMAFLHHL